jgi:leucyl-tRNA synthetase
MGPYEGANYPFDLGGIAGVRRFLERVYGLSEHLKTESTTSTRQLHKTIKKVSEDIAVFKFNTAISAMMVLVNQIEKEGITEADYYEFLRILAPFAPHLTEELWYEAGKKDSIHLSSFPSFDTALAKDDTVTIGVQINGKLRGNITISPSATEEEALLATKENTDLEKRLAGTKTEKVIYVAGRILNLIVEES